MLIAMRAGKLSKICLSRLQPRPIAGVSRDRTQISVFLKLSLSPKSFLLEGWKGRAIRTHKAAGGIVVAEQALVCVPVIN